MKKLLLTLALVFGMVATASAQINLGGRAAINFGTVWGDDTEDVPWGFGFNAGLAGKFAINDMFAVAPEVAIDLRRASDALITWSTWAIDIPVLLRVSLTPQIYAEVGPQFAILLSSEEEIDAIISTETVDLGDVLNTIEIGLAAGVGYTVMPNLDVNFRLALGFTSIIDDSGSEDFDEEDFEDADAYASYDIGDAMTAEMSNTSSMSANVKNLQFQVGVTYWFM